MKFFFKNGLLLAFLFIGCSRPDSSVNDVVADKTSLPRATPESQGIASATVIRLLDEIEKSEIEFHSIMIVRNGQVIAEGWWNPYQAEYKHTLYSLSKSFTSTAVGFAVQEGLLTVEDPVISFFPESVPPSMSDTLKRMSVEDLLTMTSGHASMTMPGMFAEPDGNWPSAFLGQSLQYEPGTQFMYNTGATYMLSAIVQQVSGMTLMEYLTPRLFEPLGITQADWEVDPRGVNVGGFGLRVTTEDIAKFGLLYLQNGSYNGNQLLPSEWVSTATSKQSSGHPGEGDWSQGYGYQFWMCRPENVYRGDGAFGQYCIVLPDQKMVIAITSESKDMAASMQVLWDHLLPGVEDEVLPENAELLKKMENQLAKLELNYGEGATQSTAVQQLHLQTIVLDENEKGWQQMTFDFDKMTYTFTVKDQNLTYPFGYNQWKTTVNRDTIQYASKVTSYISSRAKWINDQQLEINRRFVETCHGDHITLTVNEKGIDIRWKESANLWTAGNEGIEVQLTGQIK